MFEADRIHAIVDEFNADLKQIELDRKKAVRSARIKVNVVRIVLIGAAATIAYNRKK